jgi:hypothetical protein
MRPTEPAAAHPAARITVLALSSSGLAGWAINAPNRLQFAMDIHVDDCLEVVGAVVGAAALCSSLPGSPATRPCRSKTCMCSTWPHTVHVCCTGRLHSDSATAILMKDVSLPGSHCMSDKRRPARYTAVKQPLLHEVLHHTAPPSHPTAIVLLCISLFSQDHAQLKAHSTLHSQQALQGLLSSGTDTRWQTCQGEEMRSCGFACF